MSDTDNSKASPAFRFFFTRPVFAVLLAVSLVLLGVLGYGSMAREDTPDLEIPQAIVSVEWPGASAELVEREISREIEKKLRGLEGVKRFRSGSTESFAMLSVEFRAEAPLEASIQRLRAAVAEAEAEFPAKAEKPKIERISVTDTPVVTFMLSGTAGDALLGATARRMEERLENIQGVRKVELAGALKEAIRVHLLPERLKAMGLSAGDVYQALQRTSENIPLGAFENEQFGFRLQLAGKHERLETLWRLPVSRLGDGRVVRLAEVARVTRDLEAEKSRSFMSWAGGEFKKGVAISVNKAAGQDSMEVISRAMQAVEAMQAAPDWPHGMQARVFADESEIIQDSLSTVFSNGWQAMLAVFVILLLLLTWREALVAGLSIPLTFLGALGIVYLLGNSLNTIVIIGMVLALGLLVDVFILVMEGMHEGMYVKGLDFDSAAQETVRAYAMPAFAGQLTTILALAPLFAIGGVDGKFIRLIPLTTVVCLLLSFAIAFMVDIPLSRYILPRKAASVSRKTLADRITEKLAGRLRSWLQRTVLASRLRSLLVCIFVLSLLVLSFLGASLLPSQLYPKEDGRNLAITVELMPEDTLERSQMVADRLGEVLRSKDYLVSVTKYVGQKSPYAQNAISDMLGVTQAPYLVGFTCLFTPSEQRELLAYEYLPDLRDELEAVLATEPGARMLLTPDLGGATAEDPIQIEIMGPELDMLRSLAVQVRGMLARIPGATDLRDSLGPPATEVRLEPRREAMDFYGFGEGQLARQLRILMTTEKAGKYEVPGEDLDILLGTRWPSRQGNLGGPQSFEELTTLTVVSPKGDQLPVMALVTAHVDAAPQVVTHKDGRRTVTVKAKTEGRTAQEILDELLPELQAASLSWPPGYGFELAGEAESSAETYGNVGKVFVLALFLVFAVLALLFGSFRQPVIIMFSVPFALTGTMGGFFLAGLPFSFPAMVGVISLVGIVVNDAIVMLETMNSHYRAGTPLREAAARGAADRLRPIISTTLTTTVGLTPLALSDPMWMPLCAAVIFGLLAATGIALVVVPCMYLLLPPPASAP